MERSTAEISVRAADGRKPFLRQCEDKIASFLSAWLYTDGSALLFQDLPGEVKPHAGTGRSFDLRGVSAVEPLEDVLDRSCGNADPLILNLNHYTSCRFRDAYRDFSAGGRILYSIVEDIQEYSAGPSVIMTAIRRCRFRIGRKGR